MPKCIMIHDIVEENGKTIKGNNLEKQHDIDIGTLVELIPFECGGENYKGIRLHVVAHSRDCDGTPLYTLGINDESKKTFPYRWISSRHFKTSSLDKQEVPWIY